MQSASGGAVGIEPLVKNSCTGFLIIKISAYHHSRFSIMCPSQSNKPKYPRIPPNTSRRMFINQALYSSLRSCLFKEFCVGIVSLRNAIYFFNSCNFSFDLKEPNYELYYTELLPLEQIYSHYYKK
jgi:hypothetical protein